LEDLGMAVAFVLVLVVVGSMLFHIMSPWWWTPIASDWGYIDTTLVITFWITGAVFVAVVLFMAYCVWRFRHRPGRRAAYEPENRKLELWLTGATTVGVAAMLAPGLFVWNRFVHVPAEATEVEIFAQQWSWAYRLPGEDGRLGRTDARLIGADNPLGLDPDDPAAQDDVIVLGGPLHLPVDQPVHVLLRSADVLHNFYVPEFRAKMDMVPGMVTYFWFTPTRTGQFEVLCAELCGVGHAVMRGEVVVETAEDHAAWLATRTTFADFAAMSAPMQVGSADGLGR
jgi:cytochrome c oxidase subunit II